jgi:multiple sugar transport system ATP-binding protein
MPVPGGARRTTVPGVLTGLEDVTVAVGAGEPVLRGATLLAGPGEVLAVVGPSGSGKTTALRAVAGLERVRSGRVLVAGRDVTDRPTQERGVAMVFTRTALLPFLDVAGNLTRSAEAGGEPGAGERVAEQGRRLRLGRLLRRAPRTLSAGETGRVGIGRALVRGAPAAFLLDEPLAHLDVTERAGARRLVVAHVRRTGTPALYVTHDLPEAMAVGDRLAVLRDGAVAQVGPPRQVYARPVDLPTAEFVGPLGVLPADLVVADGLAGYRVGPRTLPAWGPPPDLPDGAPVRLGWRPEDVGTAPDPEGAAVPVVVRLVERPGADAVLVTEVVLPGAADGATLLARVPSRTRVQPGDRIELVLDARRAHVFDAAGRAVRHPG